MQVYTGAGMIDGWSQHQVEDEGLVLHSRHLATFYHGKFHRLSPSRDFSMYEGNLLQKSPSGLFPPRLSGAATLGGGVMLPFSSFRTEVES